MYAEYLVFETVMTREIVWLKDTVNIFIDRADHVNIEMASQGESYATFPRVRKYLTTEGTSGKWELALSCSSREQWLATGYRRTLALSLSLSLYLSISLSRQRTVKSFLN